MERGNAHEDGEQGVLLYAAQGTTRRDGMASIGWLRA